jgi:hypothetical protein
MTCAELEILLCDYVDGTLRGEEKAALESHLTGCVACAELAKDVTGAVSLIERAALVEPPAELLTRILHHAPVGRPVVSERKSWFRKLFRGLFESVLQPRYAMGMAMTILSFSMLAKFSPIEVRQLRPADLDPVKIWASIDDHAHRAWDRTMKYYDNLRLVIEVQSRLKEWSEQEQAQPVQKEAGPGASLVPEVKKK